MDAAATLAEEHKALLEVETAKTALEGVKAALEMTVASTEAALTAERRIRAEAESRCAALLLDCEAASARASFDRALAADFERQVRGVWEGVGIRHALPVSKD